MRDKENNGVVSRPWESPRRLFEIQPRQVRRPDVLHHYKNRSVKFKQERMEQKNKGISEHNQTIHTCAGEERGDSPLILRQGK